MDTKENETIIGVGIANAIGFNRFQALAPVEELNVLCFDDGSEIAFDDGSEIIVK